MVLLVSVPAVGADLDERDTRFHQPAGQQAALPERGAAVGVAGRPGSPRRGGRPSSGARGPSGRLGVQGTMVLDAIRAAGRPKPAVSSWASRPSRRLKRSHGDPRLRVVRRPIHVLDHERLERRTQEAGPDRRPADAHDVRQGELALAQLARRSSSRGWGA